MENNKELYYTPDIEDIRVGYECEITYAKDLIGTNDEYFFKYIVEPQYFNEGDYVALRTSYLTKEQIKSEGWVVTDIISPFFGKDSVFTKEFKEKRKCMDCFKITYFLSIEGRFKITKNSKGGFIGNANTTETIYYGNIRSINELRTIQKLLNI